MRQLRAGFRQLLHLSAGTKITIRIDSCDKRTPGPPPRLSYSRCEILTQDACGILEFVGKLETGVFAEFRKLNDAGSSLVVILDKLLEITIAHTKDIENDA
jgi:hypothetical protein